MSTLIRDMHMDFQILSVHDHITKLCRQQAHVIQINENAYVRNTWQSEAPHKKYKILKLGGGQEYDRSSD
jgi:hypothetical protein